MLLPDSLGLLTPQALLHFVLRPSLSWLTTLLLPVWGWGWMRPSLPLLPVLKPRYLGPPVFPFRFQSHVWLLLGTAPSSDSGLVFLRPSLGSLLASALDTKCRCRDSMAQHLSQHFSPCSLVGKLHIVCSLAPSCLLTSPV